MYSTPLSTLLNRMNRYQPISTIEEQYKVNDLDEAIRTLNRMIKTPWSLKKTTLRVFPDVLEYPVATDHDELAFLNTPKQQLMQDRPNFYYTSIQEFYDNPNDRNDLCEIWKNGSKYLGVRYDSISLASQVLSTSKSTSNYTASGDASAITADTVIYLEGANSIRFTNTVSSGTATVTAACTQFSDTNYKNKYFFISVYLTSAPTSVTLKFGNDASNYLSASVTTQFSGTAFSANDWNILAFDLNTATTTGTIDSSAFDYFAISLVGATAGYYYLENAYLRQWTLFDYWYYSTYNIKTNSASVADRNYFVDETASPSYTTDLSLVGDSEWADVITYEALATGLADEKDGSLYGVIIGKRDTAWEKFLAKYPDMVPLITNTRYNFETDYSNNILPYGN